MFLGELKENQNKQIVSLLHEEDLEVYLKFSFVCQFGCVYKPVVHLFRNESTDWTGITVNGTEIISTPGHKYFLPDTKEWVSACELKKGTTVLLSDGSCGIISAVREIHYDTPQTTYNFEVADYHTYYVGAGVCVHNLNCHELGKIGEDYIEQTKDCRPHTRIEKFHDRIRVPDFMNIERGIFIESKNVARQSLTSQLRDYIEIAKMYNCTMELYVRQGTVLSSNLQAAVDSGLIKLQFFPW